MAVLPNPVNTELKQGFTVPQVAEKHACPACPVAPADGTGVGPEDHTGRWAESLVWSIALEGKSDQDRFESLKWGLRTWDHWYFNDIDQRFGDNWPARFRVPEFGNSPERLAMAGRPARLAGAI